MLMFYCLDKIFFRQGFDSNDVNISNEHIFSTVASKVYMYPVGVH